MVDSSYLVEVYRPQQAKKLPDAQKNREVATLAELASAGGAANFVAKAGDTMTGPLLIDQNVQGIKTRLAMKLPGTQNDAPTAFGVASTYLGIGGGEWNANSYRLIGFGYIAAAGNQYPAVIGYQETSISSNTHGDLVFGVRPGNGNDAPPIVMRIRSDGQILAENPAYAPTAVGSLTDKKYVDAQVATAVPLTQKGAAGGVATLDGSSKVPAAQLPPLTHDTAQAASEAAMLALVISAPAMCVRTDFNPPHLFFLSGDPASVLANWHDMGAFAAAAGAPTALAGPAAIPGVAATYMRSDAAPAINQTAAYAWTGAHTFIAPTIAANPATKGYVDGLDGENAKLAGNQTIAGIKTFSSSPIVPTPTTDTQAAPKAYVDASVASAVGAIPVNQGNFGAPADHSGSGDVFVAVGSAMVHRVSPTTGDIFVRLEDAPAGTVKIIKRMIGTGAGVHTTPEIGSSFTIDGVSDIGMADQWSFRMLFSDGTHWSIIGSNGA